MHELLAIELAQEGDIVVARQRTRQLARSLGFDAQDQTRVATAVSELARNAVRYAGGGRVAFHVEGKTRPQLLAVHVDDTGPGIADLEAVLAGRYQSSTGMGLGIIGARRLSDQFEIESEAGHGTRIVFRKFLPASAPLVESADAARVRDRLSGLRIPNPVAEIQHQNQELIRALSELRQRQDELQRVNQELEDTNRGVVALYAELDDKADHLRRADEMKSRFLSNMSHEFRTPLNSISVLARLLLDHADGPLTAGQETQVRFIQKAAADLTDLVNDLLDLAKVEAGKIVVRPVEFEVRSLFGAMRGMLRPLLVADQIALSFEDPAGVPTLHTDEGKVSQILRNFVSNALKFTPRGEVRVRARHDPERQRVVFSVEDTGIGIAPEHHGRIFEEFGQVENPLQQHHKGTGLGLPLSKRLTELLGGEIGVESRVGEGSTFWAAIPVVYAPPRAEPTERTADEPDPGPDRLPVLVVEDSPEQVLIYRRMLRDTPYKVVTARSTREAARRLRAPDPPCAVILDIQLRGETSWALLAEMKNDPELKRIPVLVVTNIDDQPKADALHADAFHVKPVGRDWLLARLAHHCAGRSRALVVDDDAAARYVLRALLERMSFEVAEAASGDDALQQLGTAGFNVVCLDLVMPGISGLDVLRAWRARRNGGASPRTIPALVVSSRRPGPVERRVLEELDAPFLSKERLGDADALRALEDALRRAGWTVSGRGPATAGPEEAT